MENYFFVSECDGHLYDTRVLNWHQLEPLRKNYKRTFPRIGTVAELKATLRAGPYAWPGGYPLYFITSDGAALSFETGRKEFRRIASSIRDQCSDGWKIEACDINYEDNDLICDHSGKKIESAYGRDD